MTSPTSARSPGSSETLPPSSKSRMLIVCFDGTSNEFDNENTNVVKLFAMLRKDCEDEQLCYYQTGIGTYESPTITSPITSFIAKYADMAFAWYLNAHVMGGYSFLMDNYRSGDKISIFGFSRGAYTARALAGMLTKVGLLPKGNVEQVPFAWKMYTRTDKTGMSEATGFKNTFGRTVTVDFLGVWETVASTGILMSKNLPFTTNNKMIQTFRHALALDERRVKFIPTFWQLPIKTLPPIPVSGSTTEQVQASKPPKKSGIFSFFTREPSESIKAEVDPEENDTDSCDVKEVWFVGSHADVGGGAVPNTNQPLLSDIALRWMIREIIASQCGIQFDTEVTAKYNVYPDLPPEEFFSQPLQDANIAANGLAARSHEEQPEPSAKEKELDTQDATDTLHDELKLIPAWWLLEIVPMEISWQDKFGQWRKKLELHLGKGRYVNHTSPLLFHQTVKIRMDDPAMKYAPRAHYEKGKETYVW